MSDPLISISVPQSVGGNVLQVLETLSKVLEPANILDRASTVVLNRIRQRFLKEQDTAEQPWVPSKAAIRRRLRGGTGTLYETGNLFRSIQQAAVEGNETRITTDVPYAKYHQFGLGNNLKREFMGVSDLDARLVERILNKYLDDAINKTFGSR